MRETWQTITTPEDRDTSKIEYAADWNGKRPGFAEDEWSWRSPIQMPRWASRITLEITEVRVQRLQEISEEDARAEGIRSAANGATVLLGSTPIEAFAALWDSVNAKRAPWASNPWAWAISFARLP